MISLNQNMFYMKMFFNEDNSFGFEICQIMDSVPNMI